MMQTAENLPLILGGHSFIQQMGNDPKPSEDLAAEIVAGCLASGITWFDTTLKPERIALGRALTRLNASDRATVLAWNFFQDIEDTGEVGGPSAYEPHHLDLLCEQLQRNIIDILVVHSVGNADEDRRQEELALSWREMGRVRRLGVWHPGAGLRPIYEVAIAPGNIADNGGDRFPKYKQQGWETLATSPFVRGWLMERLAARSGHPVQQVADLLLRYSAYLPGVDRLIVAIRQPAWIATNIASWRRGSLNPEEAALLQDLFTRFGAP